MVFQFSLILKFPTIFPLNGQMFKVMFPWLEIVIPLPIQGSFQFYIQVRDADLFSTQHVDDIYVNKTLNFSSSFTNPTYYQGDHGNAMIQLSFRVHCDHNYYGSNCSTFCVHTDDSSGHYACGANGERVCLSGWRNPNNNCLTRKL